MKRGYALYQVALKALVRRENTFLFLKAKAGDELRWDLPGGRIDEVEHQIPLPLVLAREMSEELGSEFRYALRKPVFQFRRPFRQTGKGYVFITVYEAKYLSGAITLSDEHAEYEWLNPQSRKLLPSEFFSAEEYQAISEYFSRCA